MTKKRKEPGFEKEVNYATCQPSKAELEEDVRIPATPDELLVAVMKYNPRSRGKPATSGRKSMGYK